MGSLHRKLQRNAARNSGDKVSISPSLSRRLEQFGQPLFERTRVPHDESWLLGTSRILQMLWNRGILPALTGDTDRRDMRDFVELMLLGASGGDPALAGESYEKAKDQMAELLVQMLETRRTVYKDDPRKVGSCTLKLRGRGVVVAASEAKADAS